MAFRLGHSNSSLAPLVLHKALVISLIGVISFIGCAVMGILAGIPEPSAHDEFSYLLAADTFSRGRLTNPTHPMWVHFESFHVIHQPTYMSKYQPAQGLALALGKLAGHPIIGVWLTMALMSSAICWMLFAWLPPRWAGVGGLLTIIHPYIGVGNYWAQSYWGGCVPAAAGALLLGGVRYLGRKPRIRYALITGIGVAILANSRPYEGLILSIPQGIGLMTRLIGRSGAGVSMISKTVLVPLALIGVITASCMAYYNYRITGNALRIPYVVHEDTYGMFAYFVWQKLPAVPAYRHEVIRAFHAEYELPNYQEKRSLSGFIRVNFSILFAYVLVTGSVFLIPLIGAGRMLLVWFWRNGSGRLVFLTYVFFVVGLALETMMSLHYWAPITALNYLLIVQSMRLWRARNQAMGRRVLYSVFVLGSAVFGINAYQTSRTHDPFAPHLQRARLLTQLNEQAGRHLVIVKYGANHSFNQEWVYNEADIDRAKIVWARDMELPKNCELINYFNDRVIWSLEIDRDEEPVKLNLYPKQSCLLKRPGT